MAKHFRAAARLAWKLGELGVSVPAVLRRAGLPQDIFQQARVLVGTEELFVLWQAIGDVSTEEAIGLKLGSETRIERFHPSGLAALSTANFGLAIAHMARYKQLTCLEEMLQETKGDEWHLKLHWLLAIETQPSTLSEYCFAWILTIARCGTGTPISPLRVELIHPRSELRTLEEHFGHSIVSGARQNVMVFRRTDAERPFITRNTELLAMLAPQFDEELRRYRSENSVTELVRDGLPLLTQLRAGAERSCLPTWV